MVSGRRPEGALCGPLREEREWAGSAVGPFQNPSFKWAKIMDSQVDMLRLITDRRSFTGSQPIATKHWLLTISPTLAAQVRDPLGRTWGKLEGICQSHETLRASRKSDKAVHASNEEGLIVARA